MNTSEQVYVWDLKPRGTCFKTCLYKCDYKCLSTHFDFLISFSCLFWNFVANYDIISPNMKIQHLQRLNNATSDRRNCYYIFVRSNNYKIGLNVLSNRLRAISKTQCFFLKKCSNFFAKLISYKVVCPISKTLLNWSVVI